MESFQTEQSKTPFHIPPITNPPPRIFGGGDTDGSPLSQSFLGGSYFADDQGGTLEESNEAKRRRISRACDMCRKKKIKCDGKMPKCSHCLNYKTECIFTQVEKKRNPPKGAKYIEGLENRLGRMESLLKLSGLLDEKDGDKTDLGTLEKRLADKASSQSATESPERRSKSVSQPIESQQGTPTLEKPSTPLESATPPESPTEPEEEVEALSDLMCALVTNNCGETKYIGSSSGFSIFSPKGIQWVNEKTGDDSFPQRMASATADEGRWSFWKPEVFNDLFARPVFVPLPPRDEALSLLKDYFENFNCMFPLFHEPTFMHLVNRQYSRDPFDGSGWWASLNVALAIAHRLRVMSQLVPKEEDKKAWGFLKNAMGVLTELTICNTDLLSVQALLGMALFLSGTPNPQPTFFLVAAAIRLSHGIGLHKRGTGFELNPAELEQRKRVFWIAYVVDKDICLRGGRPPAQDEDDMNVELPAEDPSDNIGNIPLADGKGKVNLFRLMCTFAVIESKVYKQLYSTKASKQSDGELLNTIGELDRELEEWKDGIPLDFRPEHEIKASHTPLMLHVLVLHFAYYNCLTTIHRMSVHHGYWTSRLSNYAIKGLNARPLNPRVFSSAALCVQAARASIHLIKYIPQGDFSLIIYFPVSALVTLFANILQNPQDVRARMDVKLMNQVVNFLSVLSATEEPGSIKRMLSVCSEFERIAKVVLDRGDKESHSRRKRKKDTEVQQSSTPPNISQRRKSPQIPVYQNVPTTTSPNAFTPNLPSDLNSQPLNPSVNNFSPLLRSGNLMNFTPSSSPFPNLSSPPNGLNAHLNEMPPSFGSDGPTHFDTGSFQQPFVPQDLWQMPMTLEWDWADMTGMAYPDFDIANGSLEPPERLDDSHGQV